MPYLGSTPLGGGIGMVNAGSPIPNTQDILQLARIMADKGAGTQTMPSQPLSPGMQLLAQAFGQKLHQLVGNQQQQALNAATMVSPVNGP